MKNLKTKIRRYKRMEQEQVRLRRQIMVEAKNALFDQGLKAVPRFERIVDQFG